MAGPIIRLRELIALTGLARSTILDRINEKSSRYDPTFPRKFALGGTAVGWYRHEVDAWLAHCAQIAQTVPHGGGGQKKPSKPNPVAVPTSADSKPTTPRVSRSRIDSTVAPTPSTAPEPADLEELLLEGIKQNAYLTGCLKLPCWTPAMGALLVSGVKAPLGCSQIPRGGEGIDGVVLESFHARLQRARGIFKRWNEQEDEDDQPMVLPAEITVVDFFIWCDDEQIDTDWLRLLRELAGCPVSDGVKYIPTRVALMASQSTYSSRHSGDTGKDSAETDSCAPMLDGVEEKNYRTSSPGESKAEKIDRLKAQRKELRARGIRNFNRVLAENEGLSVSRIKQLLSDKKSTGMVVPGIAKKPVS